jgi:DNA-binding SARP family transcriptional activator
LEKLRVNFFGGFSITYGDKYLNDSINRSKKLWTALEYLVFYRGNEISQNDLIELLWNDENCDNPLGAMKTLIHRVRAMLQTLEFPGELILQRRGAYFWNTSVETVTDTAKFDKLYQKGNDISLPDNERLKAKLAAIDLYEGDFLPKASNDTWAIPLAAYYRKKYTELVVGASEALTHAGKWDDIIEICSRAVTIDPYCEQIQYHYILALDKAGNHSTALKQYNTMLEMLYNELGVNPSPELTELYRQISKSHNSIETDLDLIKSDLEEATVTPGAFYCEYEVFRNVYRIEARAAARTGDSNYLCLFTVSEKKSAEVDRKRMNRVMEHLRSAISLSLRRGDVFSRYSVMQYIVLLPNVNYEQGVMIAERILRRFRSAYSRDDVSVSYNLRALIPIGIAMTPVGIK